MVQFQFQAKKSKTRFVLAADMGGTKVNMALYDTSGKKPKALFKEKFHSADYKSFGNILKIFLAKYPNPAPGCICVGVAGPVRNGAAKFTNLNWLISIKDIIQITGIKKVALLNDLEATAYGLAHLSARDFENIYISKKLKAGNIVLIAPGTGLGIAGLQEKEKTYTIIPSEGGHSEYAPRTNDDVLLYNYLKSKKKIVSWEHIVSGRGIENIYAFLRDIKKMKEPAWLLKKFQSADIAAVISEQALHKKSAICQKTMKIFIENLARIASSMALTFKATGGVYLCGGIPPKIIKLIKTYDFKKQFLTSDRMNDLLKEIPVNVVLNEETALLGAAYFGVNGIS